MLEWRLKAYRHWLTMEEPRWWPNVTFPPIDYQDIIYYSAPKPKKTAQQPRRGRSGAARDLREARHLARRAEAAHAASPSMRCSTASRWRRRSRRSSPSWASSSARSPRRCRIIRSWSRSTSARSCRTTTTTSPPSTPRSSATARSVYIPKGVRCPMELSHLLPHQRQGHRPVRADADRRRGRRLRQLPRRLHRADARRESAARRRGRAGRPSATSSQIKYSTVQNWYPGDKEGKGGIYNFVTKRGACRGRDSQDLLDAGRDRLGHHLEVPELHPAGRQLGRRVLLGGPDEPQAAGRHRHQDDPHRQEHEEHDRLARASPPATARTPTAAW